MQEFVRFLRAIGKRWAALLTGGILIAALSLWERLGGSPAVPRWGWWTVAALTLVWACFLAWREQFRRVRPPKWPAVVIDPLPNIDVATTAAGVRVSAYLSIVNVSADPLTVDLTGVSIGSVIAGLASQHLTLRPHAVERVWVRGDSTAAGGIELKKSGEAQIDGWLIVPGFERQGFTIHRVPVRDAGTLATP
jgi:hypothetical protein